MKKLFRLIFLVLPFSLPAQTNPAFSVYLVGDAGEDTVPGKALRLLKNELLQHPNSAVVFLGDNAYPNGITATNTESQKHLESQLQVLTAYKGQVYFIPGNHDWDSQGRKGLQKINAEQAYVENYMKTKSLAANKDEETFLPKNGLPGPESVLLADKLRLITMDTQWFLQRYKKNKIGSERNTIRLFYHRLDSLLAYSKANNEQVVLVAHHPMYTNGSHSKKMQPLRFLVDYTPFRIFGLIGNFNGYLSQDLAGARYKKMRKKMLATFQKYDNIIYASGHEHNLQFFKENGTRYIISGCGSKRSHLRKKKTIDSVFQDDQKTGFVELQYGVDKDVKTVIYRVGEDIKVLENY